MKQTNLEIIRQACIKANPEIMELKFGCILEYPDDSPIIFVSPENEEDHMTGLYTKNNTITKIEDLVDYKIVGRPIRLSDIIFTLYKNKKAQYFGGMLDNNSIYFANRISWDLLHDDLNLQSEPTKKFIANLLKKKK